MPALQAAVIADGDRLAAALRLHPVRDALGCLTHHPDIHAVCPDTERPAKSRRTEA